MLCALSAAVSPGNYRLHRDSLRSEVKCEQHGHASKRARHAQNQKAVRAVHYNARENSMSPIELATSTVSCLGQD